MGFDMDVCILVGLGVLPFVLLVDDGDDDDGDHHDDAVILHSLNLKCPSYDNDDHYYPWVR